MAGVLLVTISATDGTQYVYQNPFRELVKGKNRKLAIVQSDYVTIIPL